MHCLERASVSTTVTLGISDTTSSHLSIYIKGASNSFSYTLAGGFIYFLNYAGASIKTHIYFPKRIDTLDFLETEWQTPEGTYIT